MRATQRARPSRIIVIIFNKSVTSVPMATAHEAFVRLERRRFTSGSPKSSAVDGRRGHVRGMWIRLLRRLPTVPDGRQTILFPRIKGLNLFRLFLVSHPWTVDKTAAVVVVTGAAQTVSLSRDLFTGDDYFLFPARNTYYFVTTLVICLTPCRLVYT